MSRRSRGLAAVALVTLSLVVLFVKAWQDTMADPVVRRATILLPAYPPDAPPLTIALISYIHVAGPDMPPARLERIVDQINALHPDLVPIAGDLVSDKRLATRHYSTAEAVAPLAKLSPTLVTTAGLGTSLLPFRLITRPELWLIQVQAPSAS